MFKIIFYYSFESTKNVITRFASVEVTFDEELGQDLYKSLEIKALEEAKKEYPHQIAKITGTSPVLRVTAK